MEKKTFRHEFKYLCTEAQLACLKSRLAGIMKYDVHANDEGKYNIRSIYFDDFQDTGFYENENGTDPREKYRIRIYDASGDRISLENKKKISGMTQKHSCLISKEICDGIISGELRQLEKGEKPVWNRFAESYNTRLLRPKVIVDYERTVFVCQQGNVRITFDKNISSSVDYDHFYDKKMAKRPVMPVGTHILEVKYDQFLLDYIYKALELEGLLRTTYSKYYLCRKFSMK